MSTKKKKRPSEEGLNWSKEHDTQVLSNAQCPWFQESIASHDIQTWQWR